MKKSVYLFCLSLFLLTGCKSATDKVPTVSVTILPQRYFVERIAGDFLKVNVMVPPGANPAATDLTPDQLVALHNSSLYFAVGYLPFESAHLYPVLREQEGITLVNHSEGLHLLPGTCSCGHDHGHDHDHGHGMDPHIWMSPAYARRMAGQIAATLGETFPEKQALFAENLRVLEADIDSIDSRARRIAEKLRHPVFLIYHPALTYFAADYGLEQVSIEHDGKEPGPAHLKAVINLAREKEIRTVFIQSQFDRENARAVAREIGGEVIPIDPLNADWKQEMHALLSILETRMQ